MTSLHVLFKNDKVTVQFTPNTPLSEILSKACTLYKIPKDNHALYTLLYNQKPVNLSIPFRLSGIPAASRVTLAQNSLGSVAQEIRIALQLDGQRLQSNFKTTVTLWDILLHFEKSNNLNLLQRVDPITLNYITPALVILNKEYSTFEELQQNSLRKLMINESCLINLKFKATTIKLEDVKPSIDNYQPLSFFEKATQILEQFTSSSYDDFLKSQNPTSPTTSTTTSTSPTSSNSSNTSPINSTVTSTTSPSSTISTTSPTTSTTSPTTKPILKLDKTPSPITTESTTTTQSSSPTITTQTNEIEKKEEKKQVKFKQEPPSIKEIPSSSQTKEEEQDKMDISPSSQTTTASSSATTTIPTIQLEQPEIDRNLQVYIPNVEEIDFSAIHFDGVMTMDDFKRLMEANKRMKKEKEEFNSILRTKTMRDRELEKKTKKYTTSTIRLYFPDRRVLELQFNPHERISKLFDFISSKFLQPCPDFYLYVSPPPKELNTNSTFFKESLYPRAKVYLGLRKDSYPLRFNHEVEEMFETTYGLKFKEITSEQSINTSSTSTSTTTSTQTISSETSTPTTTSTTSTSTTTQSSNDESNEKQNDKMVDDFVDYDKPKEDEDRSERQQTNSTKVPRWFKMGKK